MERDSARGALALALALIILLCAWVTGCGASRPDMGKSGAASSPGIAGAGSSADPPAQKSVTGDYDKDDDYGGKLYDDVDDDDVTKAKDRDGDSDNKSNSYYDSDDRVVRYFGRGANEADRRAVSALVKRYFAAAAAEDGAAACAMILSSFAKIVPKEFGGSGAPYAHGATCAVAMSKMFEHYHRQIAAHAATLKVTGVRVGPGQGLAVLGFKGLPGRQIRLAREGAVWKIDELLDVELP